MRRSLPLSKAPLASRGCSLGGMPGLLTGSDSRSQRIAFLKIFRWGERRPERATVLLGA